MMADPAMLKQAQADPSQFKPEWRLFRDSRLIVPIGLVDLPPDLKLPAGTPLKLAEHSRWRDVYVVSTEEEQFLLRYDGYEADRDKLHPRAQCLIVPDTLLSLKQPDIEKTFIKNLLTRSEKRELEGQAKERARNAEAKTKREALTNGKRNPDAELPAIEHKNYPVTIALRRRPSFCRRTWNSRKEHA